MYTFCYILVAFGFIRPISTMAALVKYNLGGVTLSEVVSLASSYIFLVYALVKWNKIKIDIISMLIAFFCFYLVVSGTWGGGVKEIAKLVLPFSTFFAARIVVDSEKTAKLIFLFLVVGFIVPVIASAVKTLLGQGIDMVVFQTGIARYMGVFTGPHAIAHSMFICVLSLAHYDYFRAKEGKGSLLVTLGMMGMGFLSTFNLYKSYTRNVYIGLGAFIVIYLYGRRNYKLLGAITLTMAGVMIFSSTFHDIFFDVVDPLEGKSKNFGEMGSGRVGGWSSMLTRFFNAPLVEQIRGLGISAQTTITSGADFAGAHNDFLSVFLCFGYLGITIYLALFLSILIMILHADADRRYKGIMVGFIVSVACMNLLSNAYLTRFELAQYFNLCLGVYFGLSDSNKLRKPAVL